MSHSLTPLAAACSNMRVLDKPALFMDALWLPYRQDHTIVEVALRSAPDVKAIFVHADVVPGGWGSELVCTESITSDILSHAYLTPYTLSSTLAVLLQH